MDKFKFTVVICTSNRGLELRETVASVEKQSERPDLLIIVHDSEIGGDLNYTLPILLIKSTKPDLTFKRNLSLNQISTLGCFEYISFLDDDVELEVDYYRMLLSFLASNPDIVGLHGNHLVDGGITRVAATELLRGNPSVPWGAFREGNRVYGCNMTFRSGIACGIRFDEELKLYGWLEDMDYSRRVATFGRLGQFMGANLVHLRARGGRIDDRALGFYQIYNPFYLRSKRILAWSECIKIITRILLSNLIKLPAKEANRKRFGGNMSGFWVTISRGFKVL